MPASQTTRRLSSMTGFGRSEGQTDAFRWHWELRSVNGKSLDLRMRLGGGFDRFEADLRKRVGARFTRGSVSVHLDIRAVGGEEAVQINEELLDLLIKASRDKGCEPQVDRLLSVRGVLHSADRHELPAEDQALSAEVLADFDRALDGLETARFAEGDALLSIMQAHLTRCEELVTGAAELDATRPEALKARLQTQVADLLEGQSTLDPDRLAQEAALLATKADVREELDRLTAHVASARTLLSSEQAIGRKFDFLCQEFNREANTLCSKSWDVDLTALGLELKSTVDQMREQVANIE